MTMKMMKIAQIFSLRFAHLRIYLILRMHFLKTPHCTALLSEAETETQLPDCICSGTLIMKRMKDYSKPITNGFLCTQCNCFPSEIFFRGEYSNNNSSNNDNNVLLHQVTIFLPILR